jgi:nucleoside-specific outer membrane channel protein Tsx
MTTGTPGMFGAARLRVVLRLCAMIVLFGSSSLASAQAESGATGFSSWNAQLAYGTGFREPGNTRDVTKAIGTFENASAWSWGSSYFFVDILQSDGRDQRAREVYAEWYPSASLSKLTGARLASGPLRDVSATLGVSAGSKTSGAAPMVFMPGLTFDFNVPGFRFLTVGAYAYADHGRISGGDNGCHGTSYQVTPAWSLPFSVGGVKLSFDGFADFIGSHGQCARQLLTQPQLKLDLGAVRAKPGKLYVGVEWQHWDNKFGIDGLDESFPQLLGQWVF